MPKAVYRSGRRDVIRTWVLSQVFELKNVGMLGENEGMFDGKPEL